MDFVHDGERVDRLFEISGASRIQDLGPVAIRLRGTDGPGRFQSVDAREIDAHDYEVRSLPDCLLSGE